MSKQSTYSIPVRYRKMENLHILFWLFKDISWCMLWKPLAITMVFPTLIIAIIITIRTRHLVSEVCHNLAIVFWITANSYWMISEFLHFDAEIVIGWVTYKHLALIPFLTGVFILGYYYIWHKPRHPEETETM